MGKAANNNQVVIVLSAIAATIIAWLIVEHLKQASTINDLKKRINENEAFNDEIKKKLRELIQKNKNINPLVSEELTKIAAFIEIKQEESAVFNLAKIIENLLKELYRNDEVVKEKARKKGHRYPHFEDYLEYAKEKGVISHDDYLLVSLAKSIRNKEAHELGGKKEKSRIAASLLAGFGVILCLCELLKSESAKEILEKGTDEIKK